MRVSFDSFTFFLYANEVKSKHASSTLPIERVARSIYLIRNCKVMLDTDLAQLYEVETKVLNQAVSRNLERFPDDFMFRLTWDEYHALRSQFVTVEPEGRGKHPKYLPRAFTQEGVAMLSGVLRSQRAIFVNVAIMRTFARLREMLASNAELAKRIDQHDHDISILYDYVKGLIGPPPAQKKPIGYIVPKDTD